MSILVILNGIYLEYGMKFKKIIRIIVAHSVSKMNCNICIFGDSIYSVI